MNKVYLFFNYSGMKSGIGNIGIWEIHVDGDEAAYDS